MSQRTKVVSTVVLAIVLNLLATLVPTAFAQSHYHVVHGWPVIPDNTMLDEVSAVAVDSHDSIFVLTRAGRKWPESGEFDQTPISAATVFVFDCRLGRFLTKWGENMFALPHSITVDNADNVWITDVALHQVFKLSHDGKLLLTLGERGKPGDDTSHFNQPSDVAVAADGSFYVSDGYGNSRIMKFAADGKFLLQWGAKGKAPGELDLPHGLALDAKGHVYVVDRENARIQVFDEKGNYISQWRGPPFVSPQDIKISNDGTPFVVEIGNDKPPDKSGILVMRPDGSVVERIGRFGNYDGQFVGAHWIAIGKGREVYVADFEGRRVQKFVRDTK